MLVSLLNVSILLSSGGGGMVLPSLISSHQFFITSKCKKCTAAACEGDYITCEKCTKYYHWKCTDLTDFVIKLHKKNPYKPWRCDSCRDTYCKDCNKTFPETNLESIC